MIITLKKTGGRGRPLEQSDHPGYGTIHFPHPMRPRHGVAAGWSLSEQAACHHAHGGGCACRPQACEPLGRGFSFLSEWQKQGRTAGKSLEHPGLSRKLMSRTEKSVRSFSIGS